MDIKKAKQLKVGDVVHCPPDRGVSGFWGRVTAISGQVCKNIYGYEYLWINVKGPDHESVWPSNRLG